jgi:hypothetical protein
MTPESAILFRNNRLFLLGILLLGILFGFCSLCAIVLTFGAVGHLLPLSADSIYGVVGSAFTTLCCVLMTTWLLRQLRLMRFNHATLNAAGIEFCYGPGRVPRKLFLPWAEISTIHTWRLPHGQAYRVDTGSGNWVEFNSYTFFRPGKLAGLISGRTGRNIERLAK